MHHFVTMYVYLSYISWCFWRRSRKPWSDSSLRQGWQSHRQPVRRHRSQWSLPHLLHASGSLLPLQGWCHFQRRADSRCARHVPLLYNIDPMSIPSLFNAKSRCSHIRVGMRTLIASTNIFFWLFLMFQLYTNRTTSCTLWRRSTIQLSHTIRYCCK